jgi:hypothetical protein
MLQRRSSSGELRVYQGRNRDVCPRRGPSEAGITAATGADEVLKEGGISVPAEVREVLLGHLGKQGLGGVKISEAVRNESLDIVGINKIGALLAGEPVRLDEMARSMNRMESSVALSDCGIVSLRSARKAMQLLRLNPRYAFTTVSSSQLVV